ncbi:MAG: hypothetical protein IPP44_30160 [Ideonella sp.]|jgi:LPS-assembly lipoprotein|nr:hypothetical protein [Ideonella sp.]
MRRRRLIAAATPLGLCMGLMAGCGFELRRAPVLPFGRIQLLGFATRSPLAEALKRELAQSTSVVTAAERPEVLLFAVSETRDRAVVAATAGGQLREVQLKQGLVFRLATAAGRELIGNTPILLTRDMSYNETQALAKEQEEAQLIAAMQSEIVMQVLRRLAGAPKP